MQVLAPISLYAPVVIVILATIAVLFSFFWVFVPLRTLDLEHDGPAAHSVLALARAATAVRAVEKNSWARNVPVRRRFPPLR